MVMAVFFPLREVEAALMLRESVTINRTCKTVRIRLSASKTDPMAPFGHEGMGLRLPSR